MNLTNHPFLTRFQCIKRGFLYLLAICCLVPAYGQQQLVLPSDGKSAQEIAPQGGLRYQRHLYLITAEELSQTALQNGMDINAIGFNIVAAQSASTTGLLKVYLQNTSDVQSRQDTAWTTVLVDGTSLPLSGLIPGQYEWQIQAVCDNGESPFSGSTSFATADPTDCNAAGNLRSSNISDQAATLSWSAPISNGFTDYLVEHSIAGSNDWVSSSTTENSIMISGLTPATLYQWRVRTRCDAATATLSSASFSTEGISACDAPSSLSTAMITEGSAKLSWTPPASATRYDIQYRPVGTSAWLFTISFLNEVNLVGLIPGTDYEWRVRTVCIEGSGSYIDGPGFRSLGEGICLPPTLLQTEVETDTSATLSWNISNSASSYRVRYRLRQAISWENAIDPMSLVHNDDVIIPDTIGPLRIDFTGSDIENFAYSGDGVYVAWEYTNDTDPLSSPNSVLATTQNTRILGSFGQDSLQILLSLVAPSDSSALEQEDILFGTDLRPATFFGSSALTDIASVEVIHALGHSAPPYSTPSPIAAVVQNLSGEALNTTVELLIKDQATGAIRFTDTQNINIAANESKRIFFASWIPNDMGTDSLIVSIPGQTNETILTNNRATFLQVVNSSLVAYADDSPPVNNAGFGMDSGLILTRYGMNGCGQVNGAQIYLDASAVNRSLYAVVLDANGNRVDSSAVFTPDSTEINHFHTFYFPNIPFFNNSFFFVGLAQEASSDDPYFPVGVQWETAHIQDSAYFRSALDGSDLQQVSLPGRLMIKAEIIPAGEIPDIVGDTRICQGTSNTLSVGSFTQRFASGVARVSASFSSNDFNSQQALGTTNVFPELGPIPGQWISETGDGQREYIELNFPSPAPINYISVYETFNPGAIDTIYVKNPTSGVFEIVYTNTAAVNANGVNVLEVDFPLTAFNVDQIRIALNSPAVPGFNGIDAVRIGERKEAADFASYVWSTGETGASISASSTGTYTVSVSDAGGCTNSATIELINPNLNRPSVILADNASSDFCEGESITLTASELSNITWSNGETSPTITVDTSGSYFFTFDDGTACGQVNSDTVQINVYPLPEISLANVSPLCSGDSKVLDAGAGFTSYQWSTGDISQTITINSPNTYSVTVTDENGCSNSASTVAFFTPNPDPVIQGDLVFCPGSSTTLTVNPAFSEYSWSTGATTPNINVAIGGTYAVSVTDVNGCTANTMVEVVALATPTPIISGSLSFCSGNTTTLDVGAGFASYLWSTGETTPSIIVDTINTYSVTVTDQNGCAGSTSATTSQNGALPVSPGPITGPTIGLCNTTGNVYSIDPVPNTTHYVWTVPEGDTIISGQGTTSITVNTNDLSMGVIVVAASNACGQSPSISPSMLLVRGTGAPPGPISGPTTGLCNTQANVYSVPELGPNLTYNWSVPGNATIVAGQGSNRIEVDFQAFDLGLILVYTENDCGSSGVTDRGMLFVEGAPTGALANEIVIRENTYTLAPVDGASTYSWEVPAGVTILSGQGSHEITIDIEDTFTEGNVCVIAENDCGSGTPICREIPLSVSLADCQAVYLGYEPAECVLLEAIPFGGKAPYSYAWSTGEAGSAIEVCPDELTTYTVTIKDADGNTVTKSSEVEVYDIRCGVYNTFVEVCRVSRLSSSRRSLCVTQSRVAYYLDNGGFLGNCELLTCQSDGSGFAESSWAPTFFDETSRSSQLSLFPNPADRVLSIAITAERQEKAKVRLINASGQVLREIELAVEAGSNRLEWALDDLASGVYFVQFQGQDGLLQSKFVKL